MSQTNTRSYILPILVIFFSLFFLILSKSSYKSLFASQLGNISSPQTLKPTIRRVILSSSDETQSIIFKDESPLVRLYLNAVRDTVCGLALRTQEKSVFPNIVVNRVPLDIEKRTRGEDWAAFGITMIGQMRLNNLEWALRSVMANGIPGDFIECGVWRGGASVFARAVLKALDDNDRHVWVVDSFQGLPKARTSNDNEIWSKLDYLRVSLEEVQTNFRSFDLLDDHVHFCKGYFIDSLPQCNVSQIAVLRMDGDMYESTMDQLFNLYSKIQVGGVIIVDDYIVPECVRALTEFRSWHNISDEIKSIAGDQSGIYWIKKTVVTLQMDRYKALLG